MYFWFVLLASSHRQHFVDLERKCNAPINRTNVRNKERYANMYEYNNKNLSKKQWDMHEDIYTHKYFLNILSSICFPFYLIFKQFLTNSNMPLTL